MKIQVKEIILRRQKKKTATLLSVVKKGKRFSQSLPVAHVTPQNLH